MRRFRIQAAVIAATLGASVLPAPGQEDVRGVALRQQGLKVIEERCLVCHNKKRIDDAVRERKNMERITAVMEKKGAALTDKEREVMNHFWKQNPFKAKGEEAGTRPQEKPAPLSK